MSSSPFIRQKNRPCDDPDGHRYPYSILSFVIATSRVYRWMEVVHLMMPFVLLDLIVFRIASYLIFPSILKAHQLDRLIVTHSAFREITERP